LATIEGAEDTYEDIFLPLHGRHQVTNLATAIASAEALIGDKLDSDALRDAASAVVIPGRLEALGSKPLVMVDGAHNADGVAILVESLREEFPTSRWQVVFGVMGDKNVELMVERLAPLVEGFIATGVDEERAVLPDELAKRISSIVDVPVNVADTIEEAIDMARAEAGPEGAVLITGSLYVVGEARDTLVD